MTQWPSAKKGHVTNLSNRYDLKNEEFSLRKLLQKCEAQQSVTSKLPGFLLETLEEAHRKDLSAAYLSSTNSSLCKV